MRSYTRQGIDKTNRTLSLLWLILTWCCSLIFCLHGAFWGECSSTSEMDAVVGKVYDSRCLLTLYLRPFKFQFALLLDNKRVREVRDAHNGSERTLGYGGYQTWQRSWILRSQSTWAFPCMWRWAKIASFLLRCTSITAKVGMRGKSRWDKKDPSQRWKHELQCSERWGMFTSDEACELRAKILFRNFKPHPDA